MENKNPFLEMKKAASERMRQIYESQEAGETVARNFRKAGQDCFRTVKQVSRQFEQVTGAWHEIAKNPNRLILTIRLWTLRAGTARHVFPLWRLACFGPNGMHCDRGFHLNKYTPIKYTNVPREKNTPDQMKDGRYLL